MENLPGHSGAEHSGDEPNKGGPNKGGDQPNDDDPNLFKGTPFESMFAGGVPDLTALMSQMQTLIQPHEGPINWDYAIDIARKLVAQTPDPAPGGRDRDEVADAIRLADHWLDETTSFPSGVTATAAWSRAEWIVGTTDTWKVLIEPVVGRLVEATSSALPEEARHVAGPLLGMLQTAAGMMAASQVGTGLGGLAGEVVGASDIGLPLTPPGQAALITVNVSAFAEGLDAGPDDVRLYLALREAAHQRLFANVPWLRDHLLGAVTDHAAGLEIDTEAMRERASGIDISDPAAMQEAITGGLFEPKQTPAQQAALRRLEIALALVEGWVDEVVTQATADRMPAAAMLAEAVRRRRAAGGPAEQTFASLVGLELRPRRLRDASTLWGSLRTRQGAEARDGVWMSPDLLPTDADLDDPLGFREGAAAPPELSEAEFDSGLHDLLEGRLGDAPDEGSGPASPTS
jgi:putative hydrolase